MCKCGVWFTLGLFTRASGFRIRCCKMVFRTLLVFFCVFRVTAINNSGENDKSAENVVWAAAGGEVSLPCDVSVPYHGDAVSMVLWFKDTTGMPLYSLDFRSGPLVHWATTDDLAARSHFVLDETRPEDAHLSIKGVTLMDEGVFRCRVDFFDSPTRNFKVNLSLVVPANEPRIFDGQGREIAGIAGPFKEGFDLYLACQVTGGRPTPEVSWWQGSEQLDFLKDPTSPYGTVTSQLFISTVTRKHYAARLQCRAKVSDLLPPTVKEIQLQVYMKPMIVHIVTPNELLKAGKPQALRCETVGSYPAARISWLLDGETLRSSPTTATTSGNMTSSIATLILSSSDDGKDLTCRATNPWFPGGVVEETRTISVAYPPRVSVSVGSSEDPSLLKEGGDVQLICNTEARPAVDKYKWFRGGDELHHNPAEGLIVLGRTMRIRNLTKEDSGNYSCKASNSEGSAKSQILNIKILYVPVCKAGLETKEIATIRHIHVLLRCEVDSPPEAGLVKFSWTYNKTRDVLPIPASRATTTGTVSELSYTPQVTGDFGTLACWATNSAGHQKQPCLFNILPAKVPDPPRECNLVNSTTLLEVICRPGDDGGIPQQFVLEVLASSKPIDTVENTINTDNEISTMNDQGAWPEPQAISLYKETGGQPRFALHGLRPGRLYSLLVYAENARGRSSPFKLKDVTVSEELASADKFFNPNGNPPSSVDNFPATSQPMAMVLGALVAATLLILLAIISATAVIICKRRGICGGDRNKRDSTNGPSMYAAPDDENGFGLTYCSPSVMIRPCADIRRDARRASRALSALQEEILANEELTPIGHEGDDFHIKPIGVNIPQDMYAPQKYGVGNIPENIALQDYMSREANMYSPMIPHNYQETPMNSYPNQDLNAQIIGLYRKSSGRGSQDFSMYAPGFGINYQSLTPSVQYARMPLQNLRGNIHEMRMSTLERRRSPQGVQTYSQGVRTDNMPNVGLNTKRLSMAHRDSGITTPELSASTSLQSVDRQNVPSGSFDLDIVKVGPDNLSSKTSMTQIGLDNQSSKNVTNQIGVEIHHSKIPEYFNPQIMITEVESNSSLSEVDEQKCLNQPVEVPQESSFKDDASSVVRLTLSKPDLILSQEHEEG